MVAEEIPQRPVFKDKSAVFNEHFAATLCGSNSSVGTRVTEGFVNTFPKGEINRRNFVEALHTNPICALPPAAWVSRSEKLEHGKSRALFACDTINCLHFDAPCSAVERIWLDKRCVLQPGKDTDARDFVNRANRLKRFKKHPVRLELESRKLLHLYKCTYG